MNTRRLALATFICFLLSNVLTTLWYLFTDDANMVSYRREMPNYAGLVINHLIYAILFITLLKRSCQNKLDSRKGFLYGSLLGALMFLPQAIVVRSIWQVDFDVIFLFNSLAHIAIGGVMG